MPIDRVLLRAAILWFGVMSGFFWSFSVAVMPGLGTAEPQAALEAMQAVNRAVRNPLFAAGFFGAGLLAAALAARGWLARKAGGRAAAGAALLYLAGVLAVTSLGNVPLNEALAQVDPASPDAAAAIAAYLRDWSSFNDVRTVSALAATAILLWCSARA